MSTRKKRSGLEEEREEICHGVDKRAFEEYGLTANLEQLKVFSEKRIG